MNLNLISDIKNAYTNLNPGAVRALSDRDVLVGVFSDSNAVYQAVRSFLGGAVGRVSEMAPAGHFDVVITEPNYPRSRASFVFEPRDPEQTAEQIFEARPDLEIPLARAFPGLRPLAATRIIRRAAQENAMFSVVTALPNVVPNVLELPWAVGEFATDTAFLTINQIRMAFLLAACYGKPIGYAEQKVELAGIVAGAFGWRSLARELAGKIPLGGGLIPKAAISYAGTYLIGRGLDHLHRTGRPMGRSERRRIYGAALEKGKAAVGRLVSTAKNRNAA